MGIDSFAYNLVLLLHIGSAIIGFGGVILNGVYVSRANKRSAAEGVAVMEVNTFVSDKVATIFIYLTAFWGFGVVGLSDKTWKFSQTWIWLSIVLFVAGVGISHALMRPRVRRLIDEMRSGGGSGGSVASQVAGVGVVLDVILLVIVILMIWKPGAPF